MKRRLWILVSILFFLVIALLFSLWPKDKTTTQSSGYYDLENSKITEKKVILEPGNYQVGNEVSYFRKWLADNNFISNEYFDSNFKNFKIEGNPSLSVSEVYNFDVFYLADYYDEQKNYLWKRVNICDRGQCTLTIRKEDGKNIFQSITSGGAGPLLAVNSGKDKKIECKRSDFHDCIAEAIKYYKPEFNNYYSCFKAGGCIGEDMKHQKVGIDGVVSVLENFKLSKVVKPRMNFRFDVALSGKSLCSGCYTSDGYGPYSVTFEVSGSSLKIISVSSPLKEYEMKINKVKAGKIFKADKECENFKTIYLYANDGYWYPDRVQYEKYGLHWQVNSGNGNCGRQCIIDAVSGKLFKGEYNCV